MAKELTDGFDLKAKVAEKFFSELFQRFTLARRTSTVPWLGHSHSLEIYFHKQVPRAPVFGFSTYNQTSPNAFPHLRLLPPSGNQSFVELHFPFRAMIRSLGFEKTAEARVVVAAQTTPVTDAVTHTTSSAVEVDLSNVSIGVVDFEVDTGTIAWLDIDSLYWRTYSHFPQTLFEDEVRPLVIDSLRTIQNVPITPRTSSLSFFAFRTYVKSSDATHEADDSIKERFLGVFANQEITSSIPSAPATFSSPPLASTGNTNSMYIYVPKESVSPLLDSAVAEVLAGVADEVEDFHLDLQNGHILATGSAYDADFIVELGLRISAGVLIADVLNMNVDLPWYLDFLDVIPIGHLLVDVVTRAINGATGRIDELTAGSLEGIGVFSSELEELPGQIVKIFLTIANEGPITIRSNGIVVPGQIVTTFDRANLEIPEPVFGHRTSKEFHRALPPHHGKMNADNLVVFPNPASAIQQSFNGCAYCYPDYHKNDLDYGYLDLHVMLSDPSATHLEVAVWLHRADAITIHDVSMKPAMQFTGDAHSTSTPGIYVLKAPVDLFAGTWNVRVERGSWTTQCDAQIPARKTGQYTQLEFQVGSVPVHVKQLAIPEGKPLGIGRLRMD